MDLYKKDYKKLYQLQDKFFDWWKTLDLPFYLTGGTALGRFYLNHRYSEDLDFFINSSPDYLKYINTIRNKIRGIFQMDNERALYTEDFTRIFITENNQFLKIDYVNDIPFRKGSPVVYTYGLVDTPENILSNKLSALIGRDEPKDIYDIIILSSKYSFNWQEIFQAAKEKTIINEIDVESRLYNFDTDLFDEVDWLHAPLNKDLLKGKLKQIADDFLFGKNNSIGASGIPIEQAKPIINKNDE